MARITTARAAAMTYNGQEVTFVREVRAGDPSFDQRIHQVVVKTRDGVELQFFASEVTLSDDERRTADKARDKREEEAEDREDQARQNVENKNKLFDGTRAGADGSSQEPASAGTGGMSPADAPANRGVSGKAQQAETSPFNRVPGEPPRGQPVSDVGTTGQHEGEFGPGDPQGRRVSAADQSHSGTVERPAPPGEESGPKP